MVPQYIGRLICSLHWLYHLAELPHKSFKGRNMRRGRELNQCFNLLGPIYTWRTFTGIKLNNNWTQYSRPGIFRSATKALSRNYTKRKDFRWCLYNLFAFTLVAEQNE